MWGNADLVVTANTCNSNQSFDAFWVQRPYIKHSGYYKFMDLLPYGETSVLQNNVNRHLIWDGY